MNIKFFIIFICKTLLDMSNKKNKQVGIRIEQSLFDKYSELCKNYNSNHSIRIRKFIELELEYYNKKEDLLKIIK